MLAADSSFKRALNSAEKAFKRLHADGTYDPKQLLEVKEYKNLIDETAKIFSAAITDNDIPAEMLQGLKGDVFRFSALKANAQLFEAAKLLTDDGKVKSFNTFSKDITQLKKDYNQNYLEAEYQFAVTSAQMAGKWAAVSDRYNLQYRTAADDRVRDSHAKLHNVTLPADDAFWLSYYPPNGWRCRCDAVEVRKSKYEASDSAKAIAAGEAATTKEGKDGKNKLAIFRFNPGAQKVVFPPEHPYGKVKGAGIVKKVVQEDSDKEDFEILRKAEIFNDNLNDLKDSVKTAYPNIAIEKINSINMYSNYYFEAINGFNRGTYNEFFDDEGVSRKWFEAITRQVNRGLDEIPDKYAGTVWRGAKLGFEHLKPYKDAFEGGTTHVEKAFLSTSYDEKKAFEGNVRFEIKSRDGAIIEKLSDHDYEKEVLFKAGQEFKVTGFTDKGNGNYLISLEQN